MSLTAEQLAERRSYFTATDSAKGITNQWGGLYGVVASKLYGIEQQPTEATDIGNALENPIIDWAAPQISDGPIRRQVWQTKGYLAATLDALVGDAERILEVTAPGWASDWTDVDEWGEPGTDQVSEYKLIQVHQQMMLLGKDWAHVAAWIRGRGKLLYLVPRDETLCKSIHEYAHWAWDTYVVPGVMPEPTEETSELALRTMQHIERVPAKRADPTPALVSAVEFYKRVRDNRLAAEKMEDHVKAMLLHYMGNASECAVNDKELLVISETPVEASTCECGKVSRAAYKRTNVTVKKAGKLLER